MKKNIAEYGLIFLAVLVLSMTIYWFYYFVTGFVQKEALLRRNLYETALDAEILSKGQLQSEEKFTVPQGAKVYLDYYRGKNTENYLKEGKLQIISAKGEVVFVLDLLDKYYQSPIDLPAGEYKIVESITLNPNPVMDTTFEEYREKKREERNADAYSFRVSWL